MNRSKKTDSRSWFRWLFSGALGVRWEKSLCLVCDEPAGSLPVGFDGVSVCKDCSRSFD